MFDEYENKGLGGDGMFKIIFVTILATFVLIGLPAFLIFGDLIEAARAWVVLSIVIAPVAVDFVKKRPHIMRYFM